MKIYSTLNREPFSKESCIYLNVENASNTNANLRKHDTESIIDNYVSMERTECDWLNCNRLHCQYNNHSYLGKWSEKQLRYRGV